MSSPSPSPEHLDLPGLITNLSVFGLFVSALVAGAYKGIKDLRGKGKEAATVVAQSTGTAIIGGAIADSTTLLMWSESNRDVVEKLDDVKDQMVELRHAMDRNTEALKDGRRR